MFCKNCGTKVSNSGFCENCGTKVNTANKIVDDKQVKFHLKSEFKWGYKLIIGTMISITIFLCITMFLFVISLDDTLVLKNMFSSSTFPIIFFIGFALTLLIMIIILMFQNMQYDYLDYNFYATKIEYKDGFINKVEKELKYKFIREIVMSENIFERMYNIGKIKIFTNANSGVQNGITIHCVKNVRKQYEIAKKIFDEGTE